VGASRLTLDDVLYWIKAEPSSGSKAVYLVEWSEGFDEQDPSTHGTQVSPS